MAAAKNEGRSRSRSRSPKTNSGWVDNHGRGSSRSCSPERFDGAATTRRSFHETMMEGARSSPSLNERATPYGNANNSDCKSYDDPQSHREKSLSPPDVNNNAGQASGRSSPMQSGNEQFAHESNTNYKEEGTVTQEDNAPIETSRED